MLKIGNIGNISDDNLYQCSNIISGNMFMWDSSKYGNDGSIIIKGFASTYDTQTEKLN